MILEIKNLEVYFPVYSGKVFQKRVGHIKAVDDVAIAIEKKEILGLVGESGCGKTTLAKAVLRLFPKSSGKIFFEGQDLDQVSKDRKKELCQKIQYVAQDPFLSLNPRMRVCDMVAEGIDIHKLAKNKKEREEKITHLMKLVELDPESMYRYPIEFSAGQRQRIAIARALAVNPSFLICDEPVSSLDVSVQDQVLKLLLSLRDKFDLTYLFITHDLAVVKMISDKVAVMYLGKIMEYAKKEDLYTKPLHPYTELLFSAIPIPDPQRARNRERMETEEVLVSAEHIPAGCSFHPRCPVATKECKELIPELTDKGSGHFVACHKVA